MEGGLDSARGGQVDLVFHEQNQVKDITAKDSGREG